MESEGSKGYDLVIQLTASIEDLEVALRPAEGVRLQVRETNSDPIFNVFIEERAATGAASSCGCASISLGSVDCHLRSPGVPLKSAVATMCRSP
jgi:hypothetical protein